MTSIPNPFPTSWGKGEEGISHNLWLWKRCPAQEARVPPNGRNSHVDTHIPRRGKRDLSSLDERKT